MADPRVDAITVRQLLDQSSGLTQAAFPTADLPVVGSLREAVAQLAQARLGADPGKEWSYHNVNYRVAARLVEVVSGERFDDYLRDRIFTPLGMDHTVATTTTRDRVPGLAEGYTVVYGVPVSRPELAEFAAGDGGIVSTADDLTGWLISQVNGGTGPGGERVLSPAGVAELHRPSAPGGEYGLGWFSEDLPGGGRKVYHGGTAWTFTSQQVLLPDSGYGIVVLSNSRPAYVDDLQGITDGLVTMAEGGKPAGAQRYRLISEAVAVTLTLATLGGYAVLVLRAQRWACRRRQRRTWTVPLRLLPYVMIGAATAAFPSLMTRIGWDVNWSQLYLVVADVRMPPTHTDEGLRAALTIRRRWPAVGVLVLSQYVERRYATELLTAGTDGVGYLLKDRVVQVDDFLDALARVAAGGTVLDPEVVRKLITQSSHTDLLSQLTDRENQVLAAMAQGYTNAAIAARLHLSQSAVEKHGNAIFGKLHLTDTAGYNRRVLAILHYLRS